MLMFIAYCFIFRAIPRVTAPLRFLFQVIVDAVLETALAELKDAAVNW